MVKIKITSVSGDIRAQWNAHVAHFTQVTSQRPKRALLCILIIPFLVIIISLPAGVFPPVETDIRAERYLEADGEYRNNYIGLKRAIQLEEARRLREIMGDEEPQRRHLSTIYPVGSRFIQSESESESKPFALTTHTIIPSLSWNVDAAKNRTIIQEQTSQGTKPMQKVGRRIKKETNTTTRTTTTEAVSSFTWKDWQAIALPSTGKGNTTPTPTTVLGGKDRRLEEGGCSLLLYDHCDGTSNVPPSTFLFEGGEDVPSASLAGLSMIKVTGDGCQVTVTEKRYSLTKTFTSEDGTVSFCDQQLEDFNDSVGSISTKRLPIDNAGKECWSECKNRSGPCEWCGPLAKCCRKDWNGGEDGCAPDEGGPNIHICVSGAADVTCTVLANDSLDDVWYDGKKITDKVQNTTKSGFSKSFQGSAQVFKEFTFTYVPNVSLFVAISSSRGGLCSHGGFVAKCVATNKGNPFHNLASDAPMWVTSGSPYAFEEPPSLSSFNWDAADEKDRKELTYTMHHDGVHGSRTETLPMLCNARNTTHAMFRFTPGTTQIACWIHAQYQMPDIWYHDEKLPPMLEEAQHAGNPPPNPNPNSNSAATKLYRVHFEYIPHASLIIHLTNSDTGMCAKEGFSAYCVASDPYNIFHKLQTSVRHWQGASSPEPLLTLEQIYAPNIVWEVPKRMEQQASLLLGGEQVHVDNLCTPDESIHEAYRFTPSDSYVTCYINMSQKLGHVWYGREDITNRVKHRYKSSGETKIVSFDYVKGAALTITGVVAGQGMCTDGGFAIKCMGSYEGNEFNEVRSDPSHWHAAGFDHADILSLGENEWTWDWDATQLADQPTLESPMYVHGTLMHDLPRLCDANNKPFVAFRYAPGVRNYRAKCWDKCEQRAGRCKFCGSYGKCCKKGYSGNYEDCGPDEGGEEDFECISAGTCVDDQSFVDAKGRKCADIDTYEMTCQELNKLEYSAGEISDVLAHCPAKCGSCDSCRDNLSFRDSKGETCEEWKKLSCEKGEEYGYTQLDTRAVMYNCRATCQTCGVCLDDPYYMDEKGGTCQAWKYYMCEKAMEHYKMTQGEMDKLYERCPVSCEKCAKCRSPDSTEGYEEVNEADLHLGANFLVLIKQCAPEFVGIPFATPCEKEGEPYFLEGCSGLGPCIEYQTDYYGSDVGHLENIASAKECQKACESNKGCQFYTYNSGTRYCWMKGDKSMSVTHALATSGRPNCEPKKKTDGPPGLPDGNYTVHPAPLLIRQTLTVIYSMDEVYWNLFTKDQIAQMHQIEKGITKLPSYRKFCLPVEAAIQPEVGVLYTDECDLGKSVAKYFYGNETFTASSGVRHIIHPTGLSNEMLDYKMVLSRILEQDIGADLMGKGQYKKRRTVSVMKAQFSFIASRDLIGQKLEGSDFYAEEKRLWKEFLSYELLPYLRKARAHHDQFRVSFWASGLTPIQVQSILVSDGCWAIGSFLVIWFYITAHTGSLFLATAALMIVCFSFPVSMTIWSILTQPVAFPVINILAFFVIIGISADNVFILTDLWDQSRYRCEDGTNLQTRMEWTLSRAGRAVLICSFTTAASFFSNIGSSCRPIREFGSFLGISVACAFTLMVLCYPSCLIFYETYWKKKRGPMSLCQRPRRSLEDDGNDRHTSMLQGVENSDYALWKKLGPVQGFFFGPFFLYIQKKRSKLICGFTSFLVLAFLVTASTIRIAREPPQLFSKNNNIVQYHIKDEMFNVTIDRTTQYMEPLKICAGCTWMKNESRWKYCEATGPKCATPSCLRFAATCGGHGTCEHNGVCRCVAGWYGWDCSETDAMQVAYDDSAMDMIEDQNSITCNPGDAHACNRRGTCIRNKCWCNEGYAGRRCTEDIDFSLKGKCVWNEWQEWSSCATTCGPGTRERERNVTELGLYQYCLGSNIEVGECYFNDPCTEECEWTQWTAWSECDVKKCNDTSRRKRTIKMKNRGLAKPCDGPSSEAKDCNNDAECEVLCPGTWVVANNCSVTCGDGTRKETWQPNSHSTCPPAKAQQQPTERTVPCFNVPCPQGCEYADWSPVEECSVTCGGGKLMEMRRPYITGCDVQRRVIDCAPHPCTCFDDDARVADLVAGGSCAAFAGRCDEEIAELPTLCPITCGRCTICDDGQQKYTCEGSQCTVEGDGKIWFPKTCGDCVCTSVEPDGCMFGEESGADNKEHGWSEWTECNAPCGVGSESRYREGVSNDDDSSSNGECRQKAERICDKGMCYPRDCAYTEWSNWSVCDQNCGLGLTRRSQYSSMVWCASEKVEEKTCDNGPCPTECGVSEWSEVTPCSATCGFAVKQMQRRIQPDTTTINPNTNTTIDVSSQCPTRTHMGLQCAHVSCVKNCVLAKEWHLDDWCTATCGPSMKLWRKSVVQYGENGGEPCPGLDDPRRAHWAPCLENLPCPEGRAILVKYRIDVPLDQDLSRPQRTEISYLVSRFLLITADHVLVHESVKLHGSTERHKHSRVVRIKIDTDTTQAEGALKTLKDFPSNLVFTDSLHEIVTFSNFQLMDARILEDAHADFLDVKNNNEGHDGSGGKETNPDIDLVQYNEREYEEDLDGVFEDRVHKSPSGAKSKHNNHYNQLQIAAGAVTFAWLTDLFASDGKEHGAWREPGIEAMPEIFLLKGHITWGLSGLDESVEHPDLPNTDVGVPEYDPNFNMNSAAAQMAMLRLCEEMPVHFVVWRDCGLEEFRKFIQSNHLADFPIRNETLLHESLRKFAMASWTWGLGFNRENNSVAYFSQKYTFAIRHKASARKVIWFLDEFEDWLERKKQGLPPGVNNPKISSFQFVRADAEFRIIGSTIVCAIISMVLGMLSVFAFTRTFKLALLVAFNVLCVVTMMAFGMFVVFQWQFSALEAISLIVFVGFSVDYGVHLMESYNQSQKPLRHQRVRDALAQTGVSIISACATTIFSAVFLFGCQIQALVELGAVIILCCFFSCMFTMLLMAPLMLSCGPESTHVLLQSSAHGSSYDNDEIPMRRMSSSSRRNSRDDGKSYSPTDPNKDDSFGRRSTASQLTGDIESSLMDVPTSPLSEGTPRLTASGGYCRPTVMGSTVSEELSSPRRSISPSKSPAWT